MLNVLIVGDPPTGKGGISRVMQIAQSEFAREEDIRLLFADPRGDSPRGFSSLFALLRVAKLVANGRSDLLHLNTASRGSTVRSFVLSCVARIFRVPYLVHLHGGGYPTYYAKSNGLVRFAIRRLFKQARIVIALTPSWKAFIQESLRVNPQKVSVVSNGVPGPKAETFREPAQHPVFVYVGRLTSAKGVPDLLRAFARLTEENVEAELLLVGSECDDATAALLEASPPHVSVLGWLANDDVVELVRSSWALVLPSHYENLPLTPLEAMSVKTAVIATRVGGVPDIVEHGVNGYLVDVGDTEGIRLAMEGICADRELALVMGEAGFQKWMSRYSSTAMSRNLAGVWRAAQH